MDNANSATRLWVVLALLIQSPLLAEPTWQTITSYEGNFVVMLPQEPTYSNASIAIPSGPLGGAAMELQIHRFVAEAEGGRRVFTVLYSDYPEAHVTEQGREAILARVRDGAVSSVQGKIRSEEQIKLNNFPGLQVTFEGGDPAEGPDAKGDRVFATFRFYLIKNRLYQVAILQAGEPLPAEVQDKLFRSFRLRVPVAPHLRPGAPPEPLPPTPS